MTVQDLEALLDYGYWANRRLLDALAQLPPGSFAQAPAGEPRSVRDLLVHMLDAESIWLRRCLGQERGASLDPVDFPTVESLAHAWQAIEGRLRAFVSTLRDTDLAQEVAFTIGGQAWVLTQGEILHHAILHGVHHRGQLTLVLQRLGVDAPNVDLLLYCVERRRL